jgi:hypothetical protein
MSLAATAIVNGALVQLGEDTVTGIDQDPPPSRLVKILPHLQPAIDAVLMRYGWLCALEYVTLSPSPDIPGNWRFPFAYVVPEGGLRFWEVARASGWERGVEERPDGASRMILRATLGGELNVSYVKRRPADALDVNVIDAVKFELAARACGPITGSEDKALKLRNVADKAILSAMGTDGQDTRSDDVMIEDRVAGLRATAL